MTTAADVALKLGYADSEACLRAGNVLMHVSPALIYMGYDGDTGFLTMVAQLERFANDSRPLYLESAGQTRYWPSAAQALKELRGGTTKQIGFRPQ